MADLAGYFQELVSGRRKGGRDRLLLAVLRLFSFPYGLLLALRAWGYRVGLLRSHRLPCPVISVGNITLGGTGKTPMVAHIAAALMGRGLKVAVLSRGYGGSARGEVTVVSDGRRILTTPDVSGDEPYLLAQQVPGLMVVVGADRYQAGQHALRELKPDLFILDDGYQHLRLKRDLNILLLDARAPLANGYTLPAGFLRERPSAVERADLVVYTRSSRDGAEPGYLRDKPTCRTSHHISHVVPLEGGAPLPLEHLKGARVAAFSGIASPASFFDLLESQGIAPAATLAFPDHADYGAAEIDALCRMKEASGAAFLVTTSKDAVKLAPFAQKIAPCYVALLELDWLDGLALDAALEKIQKLLC